MQQPTYSNIWKPKSYHDFLTLPPSCILVRNGAHIIAQVNPGVIVKAGGDLKEEIQATKFAYKFGGLYAPRIYAYQSSRHQLAYMCIERFAGVPLRAVIDSMSDGELREVATQLRAIMSRMASVKSPHGKIGSVTNGPFRNELVCCTSDFYQPKRMFDSVADFNNYWRDILLLACLPPFVDSIISQLPCNSRVQFAHGDLVPPNITVDGTRITGIIDWELAGFYPEYWEYARMHNSDFMTPGWERVLALLFPGKRREQEISALDNLHMALVTSGMI